MPLDGLDQLAAFEREIGAMIGRLDPAERRQMAREIGIELRRSQIERIAAQKNPDGSSYAPRKPRDQSRAPLRSKSGRIKRKAANRAMFAKLRKARFLQMRATEDEVSVGYLSATVARVARVHQLGLRDRVTRDPGGPEADYPARELLGFTASDPGRIMGLIMARLAP